MENWGLNFCYPGLLIFIFWATIYIGPREDLGVLLLLGAAVAAVAVVAVTALVVMVLMVDSFL